MTDDQVHSVLVRWLAGLTGAQVIKTHQSGPAPAQPYIAINLTTTRQIRQFAQDIEYVEDTEGEVAVSPVMEVEWQFSCHAYAPYPTGLLRPVRSAVQLAAGQVSVLPSIVIHDASQIRNVPDWLNERWELRAQMDIFVRGLTRDGEFPVDVIETAPIDFNPAG